ncbi:MAG: thiamine pyrophosphate-binding protein [Paludibacteraceae bacterium]|nr:thiamine pyrophosphate-binding protein [Paludibacteraceae bacterium]
MDVNHYSVERNVLLLIALLKANNIKKVIVSPGATNVNLVASLQHDEFFSLYSCVDERSAAYMACGMSAESGEPVVLSCTGATSSRNYLPGLTEAYYKKLPILAVTSSMLTSRVGHLFAQATDRSNPPSDTVKQSFLIQKIKDSEDEWDCTIKINQAISLLTLNGGGPVHLNLETCGGNNFSIQSLPLVRRIKRVDVNDEYPKLINGKIALFISSHKNFSDKSTHLIERFCEQYNAVVLCDQTSGYKGKYKILSALSACQEHGDLSLLEVDLLIHIGEVTGDYYTTGVILPKEVWRISEDGVFRDRFKKITYLFNMKVDDFFLCYIKDSLNIINITYYQSFKERDEKIRSLIPNLPFSNIWIAQNLYKSLPKSSVLHLGILQPLRAWNFSPIDDSIFSYCNVGGFGIDGNFSTLVGASLVDSSKLYFGVVGDLSFFYDINIIGNRNIGNNIRLLVVNNGKGVEFRTYKHGASIFGEDTDKYIAASGHNGNKSNKLVKHISEDLGYKYISADDKKTFADCLIDFTSPMINQSIIFEVFTDTKSEYESLKLLRNIVSDEKFSLATVKNVVKNIIKK